MLTALKLADVLLSASMKAATSAQHAELAGQICSLPAKESPRRFSLLKDFVFSFLRPGAASSPQLLTFMVALADAIRAYYDRTGNARRLSYTGATSAAEQVSQVRWPCP
jgi:hypothetical protein